MVRPAGGDEGAVHGGDRGRLPINNPRSRRTDRKKHSRAPLGHRSQPAATPHGAPPEPPTAVPPRLVTKDRGWLVHDERLCARVSSVLRASDITSGSEVTAPGLNETPSAHPGRRARGLLLFCARSRPRRPTSHDLGPLQHTPANVTDQDDSNSCRGRLRVVVGSGSRRERHRIQQPPHTVDSRRHMVVPVGVDPTDHSDLLLWRNR